jgi:hypothetical protein
MSVWGGRIGLREHTEEVFGRRQKRSEVAGKRGLSEEAEEVRERTQKRSE